MAGFEHRASSYWPDVVDSDDEPRVDSRLVEKKLRVQHESFMKTLHKYEKELSELSQLRFEIGVGYRPQGGGNPQKYAMLTFDQAVFAFETPKPPKGSVGGRPEVFVMLTFDQAMFLGELSKNTEQVVELKFALTVALKRFREERATGLPSGAYSWQPCSDSYTTAELHAYRTANQHASMTV